MGRRRVVVVLLVLLVGGAVVGLASVGADRVPSTARESGPANHRLPALLYFALVTFVDTFLGWCVAPVLLGYRAARSAGWAAAAGAAFAVSALAFYTAGSHVARGFDARELAAGDLPPPPSVPAQPSVLDSALGMIQSPLLAMAVAGAVLGSLAGYHARRWPLLLLVLAAAVALDLWRRADTPWLSVANGVPNALLVAAGAAVVAWTVWCSQRSQRGSTPNICR
ncbi:hypothetical protein [Streptomonospora litoralis]|uniref:Uncharacterized protein n=1 Tax=Streptomonospora litoralis TaxID=2498135 RepID=A0A4P6Q7L3_9ACTN|nr:hypothetical protein [Streptomonospora litoralis]QBI55431.1 hypothetical protein EKD16_18335 [Streptomonospora litoralis]